MSDLRYICTIAEHPDLQEINERIRAHSEEKKQRISFLRKQAEDAMKWDVENHGKLWAEFEQALNDKKLLPKDYRPSMHNLSIKKTSGQLFMEERETENDIGKLLHKLFT